ncbi:MAG: MotA/TolQ/ExbB proton channel family protein [Planctomycetaceae bacterium]
MHADVTIGGREAAGSWLGAWAGRALVAACLMGAWSAVTLAPVLVPDVASAQEEGDGGDEAAPEEGTSYLTFLYVSLGIKYVIVFLALSFSLVALLVMCFLQFRKTVIMPETLSTAFEALLDAKDWPAAVELTKNDDSYLGKVLSAGMDKLQAGSGYPAAVEAMQAAEGEESMRLEHKISFVSLIGALAPMFGLLGTVDGMVAAFMKIAQSTTTPKPNELATGISQALVTTLIGLWLAIPAIAAYAVLKNWLQKFNSDVDDESMRLMSRFQNVGKK